MEDNDAARAPANAEALPPPGAGEELPSSAVNSSSDKERMTIGQFPPYN